MLKISDIKKLESDTPYDTPTLKASVLEVSEIQNDNGKEKFYLVLGDETDTITATVYNPDVYEKFKKDMGIILIDILLKQSYIGVTKMTQVAVTQPVAIPENIRASAPKIPGSASTISTILESPVKSLFSVKGKVAKVSPSTTKSVNGTAVPFQELTVKDSSGKITVAVWDTMVNCVDKGHIVNITKCRVRLFEEEKKLSATKASSLQVVATEEFKDVSSDEEDLQSDDTISLSKFSEGTIVAIFEVDPYIACPVGTCNNKKLITVLQNETYTMKCTTCGGYFRGATGTNYLRIVALLNTETGHKKITMFLPTIRKMFASRGIDFVIDYDKNILMEKLMKVIPFQLKYTLRGTTVTEIVVKRISDIE